MSVDNTVSSYSSFLNAAKIHPQQKWQTAVALTKNNNEVKNVNINVIIFKVFERC